MSVTREPAKRNPREHWSAAALFGAVSANRAPDGEAWANAAASAAWRVLNGARGGYWTLAAKAREIADCADLPADFRREFGRAFASLDQVAA